MDSFGQPVEVLDEEVLREGLQDEKGLAVKTRFKLLFGKNLEIAYINEIFSLIVWTDTAWIGAEVALCDSVF